MSHQVLAATGRPQSSPVPTSCSLHRHRLLTHGNLPRSSCRRWETSSHRGNQLRHRPRAGLEIDWSDPETLLGVLGGMLGVGIGIAAPVFYSMRDDKDEQRLEELRALNRKTYEETGKYMTEEEIAAFRQPRWTDGKEFSDDD